MHFATSRADESAARSALRGDQGVGELRRARRRWANGTDTNF